MTPPRRCAIIFLSDFIDGFNRPNPKGECPLFKRILKTVFSRFAFDCFALLLQIVFLVAMVLRIGDMRFYAAINLLSQILGIVTVIYIINGRSNPGYKIAWITLVLAVPVFGLLVYFGFARSKFSFFERRRMQVLGRHFKPPMKKLPDLSERIAETAGESAARQSNYIRGSTFCPPYGNTETTYFKIGEEMFASLLADLESAEHFIFLEYFIIDRGVMWDSILEILRRKAAQGVDVRVMYDDVGTIKLLPYHYDRTLREMGIKCHIFNPAIPVLSAALNNRNHRKIAVIDGHTAYTGGINIADEYINQIERFGHWKDSAIRLYGEGVWSFTLMYLTMWEYWDKSREQYSAYRPERFMRRRPHAAGFVQPYTDNPLDNEAVGETVYLNMINRAERYVYITTPYLVIDNEMITALTAAAKSGVDVRIITPGVPDKWYVHVTSRAYYEALLEAGVRIYEYTPGFIHAKNFVCDDRFATVGSINLDYRSLYLHFECGVWLCGTASIAHIKADFLETLRCSRECTLEEIQNVKLPTRLLRSIMRTFSPLL